MKQLPTAVEFLEIKERYETAYYVAMAATGRYLLGEKGEAMMEEFWASEGTAIREAWDAIQYPETPEAEAIAAEVRSIEISRIAERLERESTASYELSIASTREMLAKRAGK